MSEFSPEEFHQIKNRALRLLANRDHSIHELRTKLRRKNPISDETFQKLVESLSSMGYLTNEGDLAARLVRQWRSENRGRFWITGKLRSKKLPEVDLHDDEEEFNAALDFVERRFHVRSGKSLDPKTKGKLARSLVARGFSTSVVTSILKMDN